MIESQRWMSSYLLISEKTSRIVPEKSLVIPIKIQKLQFFSVRICLKKF